MKRATAVLLILFLTLSTVSFGFASQIEEAHDSFSEPDSRLFKASLNGVAAEEWTCPSCGHTEGNDGKFCINCGAAKPEPAESDEWTCTACGQAGNNGNFCFNCGAAKPAGEWTCSSCGLAGNTGNFCPNCGAAKTGTAAGNGQTVNGSTPSDGDDAGIASPSGDRKAALAAVLQDHSSGIRTFQSYHTETWIGSEQISFPVCPVGLADLNGDGNPELLFLEEDREAGYASLSVWTADRGTPENVLYVPDVGWIDNSYPSDLAVYIISDGSVVVEYDTNVGWALVRLGVSPNGFAAADQITREDDGVDGTTDECTRNGEAINVKEYQSILSGWQDSKTTMLGGFPYIERNCFGFGYTLEDALATLGN